MTAYWRGFQELETAPVLYGFQAEGAAPLVNGAPVANPETVASAIRIGNPARWEEAMAAFTASRGRVAAVSDEQILDAYRWLADTEGVFCEPASAASVAGLLAHGLPVVEGAEPARVGRLRAHRPRPQGPRHRPRQGPRGDQLRERPERGRASRLRLMTARHRLVRVPASSANLGPGYDAMAAAVSLHLELEVEETGEFSLDPGGLDVSTGRDNLIVRAFESLHPADGIAFRLRSEIPLARGLGSSAAAIVAGLFAADHLFELALSQGGDAGAGDRAGGPSRQRRRGDLRRLRRLRRRARRGAAGRPASTRPEGLEGIVVIPPEEVSTKLAREAIPAEVPLADAVANVSAAALLVLGLRSADLDLVSARPRRPHPPAAPPRPLPALDGDRRLGARARRARGDDLRRRPDRARLDHLAGRRQRRRRAGASAAPAGPRSGACRSPRSAPTSPSSSRWTGSSRSAWSSWRWAGCWAGRW